MKAEEIKQKMISYVLGEDEEGREVTLATEHKLIEEVYHEVRQLESQLEEERENKRELLIKYDQWSLDEVKDPIPKYVSEMTVDKFLETQTNQDDS